MGLRVALARPRRNGLEGILHVFHTVSMCLALWLVDLELGCAHGGPIPRLYSDEF